MSIMSGILTYGSSGTSYAPVWLITLEERPLVLISILRYYDINRTCWNTHIEFYPSVFLCYVAGSKWSLLTVTLNLTFTWFLTLVNLIESVYRRIHLFGCIHHIATKRQKLKFTIYVTVSFLKSMNHFHISSNRISLILIWMNLWIWHVSWTFSDVGSTSLRCLWKLNAIIIKKV